MPFAISTCPSCNSGGSSVSKNCSVELGFAAREDTEASTWVLNEYPRHLTLRMRVRLVRFGVALGNLASLDIRLVLEKHRKPRICLYILASGRANSNKGNF